MAAKKNTVVDAEVISDAVAIVTPLTDQEMYELVNFDDIYEALLSKGEVGSSAELGDGYTMLEDKNKLVDVPTLFVQWKFITSDKYGDESEFVVAHVATKEAGVTRRFVIVDGSTGINTQLRTYTNRNQGRQSGMLSVKGLRRSDYKVEVEGKFIEATTFYINTDATS